MKNNKSYHKDKNGINKLNLVLINKLEKYDKMQNPKISDIFSYLEFCEIFTKTTLIFNLEYKDNKIELINTGTICSLIITNCYEHLCSNFSTAQELLSKAKIEDHLLSSIWNDII